MSPAKRESLTALSLSSRQRWRAGEPKIVAAGWNSGDQNAKLLYLETPQSYGSTESAEDMSSSSNLVADDDKTGVYTRRERPQLPPTIGEEEDEEKVPNQRVSNQASSVESSASEFTGPVRGGDRSSIDSSLGGGPLSFEKPRRVMMTHEVASPALPKLIKHRTPDNRLLSRRYEAIGSSHSSVCHPDPDDFLMRTAVVVQNHVTDCELSIRRGSASDANGFRLEEGKKFHEANFTIPRHHFVTYRLPLAWTGFQFSMHKVVQKFSKPAAEEVYQFLKNLFFRAQLSSECSVTCLIYVERLMNSGKVPLLATTWRPILLCSMLMASKVWQDFAAYNIEFSAVYPEFSLEAINKLERSFCEAIDWKFDVPRKLYSQYYYGMRSLNEKQDFRRRYNYAIEKTSKQHPRHAEEIAERSEKLGDMLSKVLSRSY